MAIHKYALYAGKTDHDEPLMVAPLKTIERVLFLHREAVARIEREAGQSGGCLLHDSHGRTPFAPQVCDFLVRLHSV